MFRLDSGERAELKSMANEMLVGDPARVQPYRGAAVAILAGLAQSETDGSVEMDDAFGPFVRSLIHGYRLLGTLPERWESIYDKADEARDRIVLSLRVSPNPKVIHWP